MRKNILALLALVPLFTFCTGTHSESPNPLNVLYVTGGCCHDYEAQEEILTQELSERLDIEWTIDFEADDSRDFKLSRFDDPNWNEGYDAVLYNMCFAEVTDNDYIENITQAHYDSGTAAIFLHCSMHTFRDAETEEWDRLIGLETYHHEHEQREFEFEALDREHPVMDSFPEGNWVSPTDELYIVTKTYENLIPLAHSFGPESNDHHVVMWANTYGNARVIGTTAGHNDSVMQDPVYLDFLGNGLRWITDK